MIASQIGIDDRESVKRNRVQIELSENNIVGNPGLRKLIDSYHIDVRDELRRRYLAKGPCQPYDHDFPRSSFGHKHGGDTIFTEVGFRDWKTALEKIKEHEGPSTSAHRYAKIQCSSFQDQRHNVDYMLAQISKKVEVDYRIRLTTVVDAIRVLLQQGLAFHGHDESKKSMQRGNFLALLK
ncbi:uncharacterized protein LOC127262759 [Andrographis paniculata]|uniref:uncharacterized protein LOC127262759 n=1 Tax=Andrographis paniculata TaxID=175694 RepID=UPI0021E8CD2D|nr:uncharacterized protein LOC127262759 [Andrographis paniculata]